jgi:CRP-like cAMP-binding protein
MVSKKELQRYSLFTRLNDIQLNFLVNVASTEIVTKGQYVCEMGKILDHFFLIEEGEMEVLFELPKIHTQHEALGQPSQLKKESVVIGYIGPGDICGWSGLVPPHISTSSVRAITQSKIIAFGSKELLKSFESDCQFGYFMFQAAAQAIGKRLRAIYHQSVT